MQDRRITRVYGRGVYEFWSSSISFSGNRDMAMVKSLGSGIPRMLQTYGKECFQFMNHFIRIVIPFIVHENVVEDVVETSVTLSKKLSVTPRTIQRNLDTLQRLGVIYRVGSDKDGTGK